METDKYTVQDLVNFAFNQKANDFKNAFDDILVNRIADAVDDKKIEVAQNMFAGNQDAAVDDDTDYDDYEDESDYEEQE